MPIRQSDARLLKNFDAYFTGAVAELVDLSRDVMDRATAVRAQYGFKTPDAIHLAAAVVARCDVFLTNDHRLDRFAGITIEVVQP